MKLRVLDLECTGLEATDHVVEAGWCDIVDGRVCHSWSQLVRPPSPITPASSAVHHITDEDVAGAPIWAEVWPLFMDQNGDDGIEAFVAHFAQYERMWLADLNGAPWICTFKCALRVWPEFEGHGNQEIRYRLRMQIDRALASPPHRAGPDAYVTAHILLRLLQHATIEEMIAWTAEPALYPRVTFGKHKGKPWSEPPQDYWDWCLRQDDMDEDIKWNIRREMERRAAASREAFTVAACEAAAQCVSVPNLEAWFSWEAAARHNNGVVKGTPEYDRIVQACVERKAALVGTSAPAEVA